MLRSGGSGPSDRAPARRGPSSRRRIGVIVQWPGDDRAQGGRRHSTRRHDVSQRRICRGTLIHKIQFSKVMRLRGREKIALLRERRARREREKVLLKYTTHVISYYSIF